MDPIGNTLQLITDFLTNPLQALVVWGPFLFAVAWQAVSWIGASILYPSLLLLPLLITTLAIVAGVLERLLELFNMPPAEAPAEEPAAAAQAPARADQPNVAPVMTAPPAPSGAPISANTVSTGTAPAPGSPAAAAAPIVPYAVAGRDPGEGFSPTARDTTGAKAPAASIPAAASGVAASAAARRKRRRKQQEDIKGRGFADAYMDYEDEPEQEQPPRAEPRVTASERGAGPMGFSGTVDNGGKGTAHVTGLTTLAGDPFGGGPKAPMLPGSWDPSGGDDTGTTDDPPENHHRKENP
jgi:hypothetical protein